MSKKPVPKKKQAVSSTKSRHSKYAYTQRKKLSEKIQLTKCSNCGAMRRTHYACEACGFYRGRQVLNVAREAAATTIEA